MPTIFWDAETRSAADLRRCGAWRYAADPSTEVLCVAFAVDNEPTTIWAPGEPIPPVFVTAAADPTWTVVAHNHEFERAVLTHVLAPRFGWPLIPIERELCTMVLARAAALPGSLEGAALAIGLSATKDKAGVTLMRALARSAGPIDPAQLDRLAQYCCQDVEATRALFQHLPPLPPDEQRLFELDAEINRSGFAVDRDLAEAARSIAKAEATAIDAQIAALTGGEITGVHQRNKILDYCQRNGSGIAALGKRNVSAALARQRDDDVGRLLQLRREGAKSSTAKFDALLAGVDADGRMRGCLKFYGSSTGRWSAARFQPQNLPKPVGDVDAAIAGVVAGDIERVRALGAPLAVASDVLRSTVIAAPGHRLIGADFSAIESRVLAWLAAEEWKLDSYREFDASGDPTSEPYCQTASRILRRPVTPENEADRTIGKTCDLAFGFGGGRGAFRKFDDSDTYSDTQVEAFKNKWRQEHSMTVRLWYAIDNATKRAINGQPSEIAGGKLKFAMEGAALAVTLPSGRALRYPRARLGPGKFENTTAIFFHDNAKGRWAEIGSWYGTFIENVTQAVARDLLGAAMLRLEAAGYPVTLHVHDEIVAEVPDGFGSEDDFLQIMLDLPPWAEGLPIAGKAWSGPRYGKGKPVAKAETVEAPGPTFEEMVDAIADNPTIAFAEGTAITAATATAPPPIFEEPAMSEQPHTDRRGNGFDHDGYSSGEEPRGRDIAHYIYRLADGTPYLRVTRTSAKQFPQFHWNGGGWAPGKPAGPKIPYRLPELLAAPVSEPVFICEGEKDADNVGGLGLVATSASGGAKAPWPVDELNRHFFGKQTVFVLADNDAPGREHAHKVAAALRGVVPKIKIVSFPELGPQQDVSDWLALGHTREELLARAEAAPKAEELESVRASAVETEALDWLWPDRFALGKLGLVVGLPDVGKGQFLCYASARVSNGAAWPCGEGAAERGNVVVLTAEDNLSDTVVPRLMAAGADLDRVHFIRMVPDGDQKRAFSLITDLGRLARKIDQIGDVRMVLIDPISAYLGVGKVDSYRATDVRGVLTPLVDLAEEKRVAIIGVLHFNKKTDVTNALLRVSDSAAFGAVARHVYAIIEDTEHERQLFTKAKNNLASKSGARTLAFRFQDRDVGADHRSGKRIVAPYIAWDPEPVDISASEAMEAANSAGANILARDEAKTFVLEKLAGGPIDNKALEEEAEANGISKRTLRRAKQQLRVRTWKEKGKLDGAWFSELP